MTVGFLTNIISPHQLPLSKAIAERIGNENYRYYYTEDFHSERANMGWRSDVSELQFRTVKLDEDGRVWLENADLVYCEERDAALFKARIAAHKKTIYVSERWFRPPFGWLRMLHPRFLKMAYTMVRCLMSDGVFYFPQGVHAWNDMKHLCRLLGYGDCEQHFRMWGYFVESSHFNSEEQVRRTAHSPMKILWVGRPMKLKRVDTLIRAVAKLANEGVPVSCTIVGDGYDKDNLMKFSKKLCSQGVFHFVHSVPIDEVRSLMHNHDVYVFPSNSREGWGAVVSEALEEGMLVLGSCEAGASATILPNTHKFHAGDWRRLAMLLQQVVDGKLQRIPIGDWTAAKAAERLVEMAK